MFSRQNTFGVVHVHVVAYRIAPSGASVWSGCVAAVTAARRLYLYDPTAVTAARRLYLYDPTAVTVARHRSVRSYSCDGWSSPICTILQLLQRTEIVCDVHKHRSRCFARKTSAFSGKSTHMKRRSRLGCCNFNRPLQ